jgi:hypothetical protein
MKVSEPKISGPLAEVAQQIRNATDAVLSGIRSGEITEDTLGERLSALLVGTSAAAIQGSKGARRRDLEAFVAAIDAYAKRLDDGLRGAGIPESTHWSRSVDMKAFPAVEELETPKHLKAKEKETAAKVRKLFPELPQGAVPIQLGKMLNLAAIFRVMALDATTRGGPVYTVKDGIPLVVGPNEDPAARTAKHADYTRRFLDEPLVGLQEAFDAHASVSLKLATENAAAKCTAALERDPSMAQIETVMAHLDWCVLTGAADSIGKAALSQVKDPARIRLFAKHYATTPGVELNRRGVHRDADRLVDLAFWADQGNVYVPPELLAIWDEVAKGWPQ